MESLALTSLKKPVTIIMAALTLVLLGVIAWQRLPLRFLPDMEQPFLVCSIPYPGSSPEQVVQQIAIPMEGELRTIPNLQQISTTANLDGCTAFMRFGQNTNMAVASAEVRDRIERLKLLLPTDVEYILLNRFSTSDIPVMVFGIFQDGDLEQFTAMTRKVLEPRIRRVEGVANVQVRSAMPERELLIEFQQDTLQSLHLDISQVLASLRSAHTNISAGMLHDAGRRYLVRVAGEFRDEADIAETVVGKDGLRLKQVAQVRYGYRGDAMRVSLDGRQGVIVFVVCEQQANVVAACRGVNQELKALMQEPQFKDSSLRIFFDQAEIITGTLDNLVEAGWLGGLMALAVLFVILHRVRPTLIVALALPTSLVVALVFMFFWGMTLNIVTMVSMIIAVGMLVDNAIVVVENTIRHRKMGSDPRQSAVLGANEVGIALIASTATHWVVFLPMFFMESGSMSTFMLQLGLPMLVAVAGSLLAAYTLIPLFMSRMKPSRWELMLARADAQGRWSPVEWLVAGYGQVMRWTLHWRLLVILMISGLVAWTLMVPTQQVGMQGEPEMDTREVRIRVEFDPNYTMEMATSLFTEMEEKLQSSKAALGIKNILVYHGLQDGTLETYLYDQDEEVPPGTAMLTTEEARKRMVALFPKRVPGATVRVMLGQHEDESSEGGMLAGGTVSLRLRGDDLNLLQETAGRLIKLIEPLPDVEDVRIGQDRVKEEIAIRIDEALLQRTGATPFALAATVDAALRGVRLPSLKKDDREIAVWGQYREEDRKSRANLENVPVLGQQGGFSPVGDFISYERRPRPEAVTRINGKNVIVLTVTSASKDLRALQNRLNAVTAQFELPVGYSIDYGQELEKMQEQMVSFIKTMIMAVVLIYLVMAALFESLVLPLSVLTTVPMALGGAAWALYLTNTKADQITLVGCVLMAGVIVNNGIVIVDHINHLRADFPTRTEAIIRAGMNRFRPVVMTALTTILGLVPLALATTGGATAFSGLGRALSGGMLVGTVLTLLVVPMFYSLLDDVHVWLKNFWATCRTPMKNEGDDV